MIFFKQEIDQKEYDCFVVWHGRPKFYIPYKALLAEDDLKAIEVARDVVRPYEGVLRSGERLVARVEGEPLSVRSLLGRLWRRLASSRHQSVR